MELVLSILYYLGTLSVFIVAVTYPQYWAAYAYRPTYQIMSYSNYSMIVSTDSSDFECLRIINPLIAEERLKFVNEINTWFVLFFTVCDWIIMMVCSIGAMIVFYKTTTDPGSIDKVKAHMLIEFLSLVSLLLISPLSYPSLIDNYEDCLEDNPFMLYGVFLFIEYAFFVVVGFCVLQLILFTNEDALIERYGRDIYRRVFYFVRGVNVMLLVLFFVISMVITIGTNSMMILASIVLDSGVGLYTLYNDALRGKNLSDILPISPRDSKKNNSFNEG